MPTTISPNGHHSPDKTVSNKPPKISRIVPRSVMAPARPEPVAKPPQPTQFLAEYEDRSWRTTFYNLRRHHFGSTPLTRWVSNLLFLTSLITAAIWLGGWLFAQNPQPGIGIFSLLCLAGAMAWVILLVRLHLQDFVEFDAKPPPDVFGKKLTPENKIPVYVTGQFHVEGKSQRFTNLSGFYRSFATREHVLLCQRSPRTFLRFCRWPQDEVGMWYIFFKSENIKQIHCGELHFGRTPQPALAIEYLVAQKSQGVLPREREGSEVIYLVCQNSDDRLQILADLVYDFRK